MSRVSRRATTSPFFNRLPSATATSRMRPPISGETCTSVASIWPDTRGLPLLSRVWHAAENDAVAAHSSNAEACLTNLSNIDTFPTYPPHLLHQPHPPYSPHSPHPPHRVPACGGRPFVSAALLQQSPLPECRHAGWS